MKEGKLIVKVKVSRIEPLKSGVTQTWGTVDEQTIIKCKVSQNSSSLIKFATNEVKQIFKEDISFQSMGIGGLDAQFSEIFRRAFNSRRYPAAAIERYGIKHCKGMLLYGPPGTGKTLIARQISKALNCAEPQVVNGP